MNFPGATSRQSWDLPLAIIFRAFGALALEPIGGITHVLEVRFDYYERNHHVTVDWLRKSWASVNTIVTN